MCFLDRVCHFPLSFIKHSRFDKKTLQFYFYDRYVFCGHDTFAFINLQPFCIFQNVYNFLWVRWLIVLNSPTNSSFLQFFFYARDSFVFVCNFLLLVLHTRVASHRLFYQLKKQQRIVITPMSIILNIASYYKSQIKGNTSVECNLFISVLLLDLCIYLIVPVCWTLFFSWIWKTPVLS